MKARELVEKLQRMDPEADVITGFWNGHTDTYTMIDDAKEWDYDEIKADFFGTPGAVDLTVFTSKTKKVIFLCTNFPDTSERVFYARRILWRILLLMGRHRSKEWKKERIFREIQQLNDDNERIWFDSFYGR